MQETLSYLVEFFKSDLGMRTLIISVLVGSMCGMLGCFIVLRNMALIGDALAHAILPGIVLAFVIAGYSTLGFFIGSVLAGLLSAFLITWLQQKVRIKNDAAIGIIFTFMFSVGIIGISWISGKQGVHLDLKDFLFGNLLSVSQEDLYMSLIMLAMVSCIIILFYRPLFVTTFQPVLAGTMGINSTAMHYLLMLLLSLVVVASLRSVGVILVVSMLITPASAALLLADRLQKVIIWASVLGSVSAILGLILSISFDFPVGPSMAVMTTFIYVIIALLAPKRGFIPRWQARNKLRQRILIEDILKHASKNIHQPGISLEELVSRTGQKARILLTCIKKLVKSGLITVQNETYKLTAEGITRSNQIIRAHRLWETFLVEELGLNADQIHEEAEQFEHHLSEDDLMKLDEQLGYPEKDPHGSPIPKQ